MRKAGLVLSGMLLILASAGCAPRGPGDRIVMRMYAIEEGLTEEQETRLGAQLERALLDHQGASTCRSDDVTLDRLRKILKDVAAMSHRPNLPWRLQAIDAPAVNVVALPGGVLFATSGFCRTVGVRDGEAAAVIAHEVAHVCLRHLARRSPADRLAENLLERIRDGGRPRLHSPIDEAAADRLGALYMALAGYDPAEVPAARVRLRMVCGPQSPGYVHDHGLETWAAVRDALRDELPCIRRHYLGAGRPNPRFRDALRSLDPELRAPEVQVDPGAPSARPPGSVRLSGSLHTTNSRGQAVLSFDLENTCATAVGRVVVDLLYLDERNRILYQESAFVTSIPPRDYKGGTFVIKAVPYVNLKLAVSEVSQ